MRKATVKVMKRKPVSDSEEGKIAELMREVLIRLGEDRNERDWCAPR